MFHVDRLRVIDNPSKTKTFRTWYNDPATGTKIWEKPKGIDIPYHLPEVQKASLVYITEGEKAADALFNLLKKSGCSTA